MADPKNKWDQPAAPPAPMFFGKKERDLVKQVNDELSERIIGQPIAYYPISIDDSNFNETYGEAIEKVSLPPVRVYAYVEVESDQTNEIYGYEYQTKLKVYFSEKRISEDQNLYVRVGDFVQYGDFYYEIVRTYDDTRYYFGQVEHKFQVAADCVRARQGAFRVVPSVTRPTERESTANNAQSPAPRAAPYPPLAASYVTVTADSKLPNERVLTAGAGITITDGGANNAVTIAASGQNAVGPTSSLQLQAGAGVFTGSANFLFVPATNVLTLAGTANITGTLSASSTISAASVSSSLFNLIPTTGSKAGPGSFLVLDTNNNVVLTTGGGAGSGDGIFTVIDSSNAYVTSSLAIGGTSAPDHKMAISGSLSASVNVSASAFYGDASNLSNLPAGGLLTALNASSAYLTSSLAIGGASAPDHALSLSGSFSASVNVSASAFYGSGTGLTGISADGVDVTSSAGNVSYNVVFTEGFQSDGSLGLGGNTGLNFNPSTGFLQAPGAVSGTAGLTGSAVKTDGLIQGGSVKGTTLVATTTISGALGVSGSAVKADGVVQGGALVSTGALSASSNLSIGGNGVVAGHLTASVGLSGSTLQATILSSSYFSLLPSSGTLAGPGSYLALNSSNQLVVTSSSGAGGIGGLFTAINGSSAYITSSVAFGGTTAADHAVSVSGSLSASVNISASAFYGAGASLTSLTIGTAEDSSYSDGLFTDFATTTPVGTAVDRFNEILKALSPGPAPNLDDVDCNDSGASSELSFGASQAISGYTNVGTAAGFSAVDINGTYGTSTSSNNLRRAVFGGSTVIDGELNEDVSADGVNYPANSFGDANTGNLQLEVNGAVIHTASMTDPDVGTGVPGSGTGTDLNSNGSGFFTLSQTGSAEFDDTTELDLFQHRTGKYKVTAADQRDGWNYLRVIHTASAFSRPTNYVAWVNDSNSSAITASNSALDSLSMTGDLRLSGVKYHRAGTAQYRTDVGNAYRNVYTSTNISYTVTNGSIPSLAMPSISVGSETEMKILQLTGSLTIDGTSILNSSIAASVNVAHPIKSNLSSGGSQSISGLLAYNRSNNSSTTSETFRREDYRLDSGSLSSYGAQANVTDAGNAWNSTSSLLTIDGLLFYNQRLYSPIDGDVPNSGNFSTISNGPGSNVNYSTISGTRTFFRYFTNTGAASQTNFELTFGGDSSTRIVPSSTALSSTNIHVFMKLPTTSTAMETGWLDLGVATANDPAQLSDFDGAYVGTVPGGGLEINSDTHEATLVTQTVEQNENIVIKIVADAAWTGYISSLSISWG